MNFTHVRKYFPISQGKEMFLRTYVDDDGKRVYTLKVIPSFSNIIICLNLIILESD
jgi:hypothetical protein